MKKNGTRTETYWAIARYSAASPHNTELVGRYRRKATAESEQPLYGGYVVKVVCTTTWCDKGQPRRPVHAINP